MVRKDNKIRCIISGKIISSNKEAVLVENIEEYIKKQGCEILE